MTFDTLKGEISALAPAEQRRLVAFLVAMEDQREHAYSVRLSHKIDDQDPSHWLTLEQLDERLGPRDDSR